MRRDDDTRDRDHANRLPDDLSGSSVSLCSIRCRATAITMVAATNYLLERALMLPAYPTPPRVSTLECRQDRADVNVVVAAVDECPNDKSLHRARAWATGDRSRHRRLTRCASAAVVSTQPRDTWWGRDLGPPLRIIPVSSKNPDQIG